MKAAILLVAHGTVDALEDLPAFVTNIRRGHAAPAELIAELRRRYEAIGGSPLNAISREVAAKVEARTGVTTRMAMRLWRPYPREVLKELVQEGVERVAVVALAQHSAHVYADAVREASAELALEKPLAIVCAENWGRTPALTRAFATEVARAVSAVPREAWGRTTIIMTAHSLPMAVLRGGDPYESEVRASAEDVAREARRILGDDAPRHVVAFQSQGMSTGPGGKPMEWLGPDLKSAIDDAHARSDSHVIAAPIGFLADHVEILYDLDVEAAALAKERGMTFSRTESLNAKDALIDALCDVARPLLAAG
jgi:ferrochelatase